VFLLYLFPFFVTKVAELFTPKLFLHVIAKAKIHCDILLIFCKGNLILTNSAIIQGVRINMTAFVSPISRSVILYQLFAIHERYI